VPHGRDGEILGLFVRAIFASLRHRALRRWEVRRAQCGTIVLAQRFGNALILT